MLNLLFTPATHSLSLVSQMFRLLLPSGWRLLAHAHVRMKNYYFDYSYSILPVVVFSGSGNESV
jgi:hypothetical protein